MKNFLFLLSFLLILLSTDAFSAVKTWDGGGTDGNWQTPSNWVGDVLPAMNDDLVFPANAAQFATTNNLLFGANYKSITFEGGNYTVGGSFITLSSGGLIVNGGTQAINVGLILSVGQTFTATNRFWAI